MLRLAVINESKPAVAPIVTKQTFRGDFPFLVADIVDIKKK